MRQHNFVLITSTTSSCHHAIGGMKLNVKEMCQCRLFFNNMVDM